ncbi:hypothetical protein NKR19_g4860 [Coniochaeta hoffmannii]|uniref:Uncharacterized protein n=1 Tax=Coniochaeta hoffmannii TaxID=91930 RepID=A0AA38S6F6_9PEZI|nr:hypothetical protein NKR19_g4860 [Coniochaeta hoffmannii]
MCPTNCKTHLCYHPTATLLPLLTTAPTPAEAIFCRDVITAILTSLTRLCPRLDPTNLDTALSFMGPGSPLAECLTDANLHAPLYLNSEELFSAGMKVLCNGVRRWVCVAVEDGILRQRGEGGGGWEWMWEGRDVQGWVTERVWKDARFNVLENLVKAGGPLRPRIEDLTAAQKRALEELFELAPERFALQHQHQQQQQHQNHHSQQQNHQQRYPQNQQQQQRQCQIPRPQQQPQPPQPNSHPQQHRHQHNHQNNVSCLPSHALATEQIYRNMETIVGRQIAHMTATHSQHLSLDEYTRVLAGKQYYDRSIGRLSGDVNEEEGEGEGL